MNGDFDKKVRAAATAGWFTGLIGAIWLAVSWVVFLLLLRAKTDWVLTLWGGGSLTWEQVHMIMIYAMAVLKLVLFVFLLCTIWLTIMGRRLTAQAGS